jgi:hypothetical protein
MGALGQSKSSTNPGVSSTLKRDLLDNAKETCREKETYSTTQKRPATTQKRPAEQVLYQSRSIDNETMAQKRPTTEAKETYYQSRSTDNETIPRAKGRAILLSCNLSCRHKSMKMIEPGTRWRRSEPRWTTRCFKPQATRAVLPSSGPPRTQRSR